MKRTIFLLTILFIANISFAQEETKSKGKGEMKFEKTHHDFGVFAPDTAILTFDFVFTNVGKEPIIIHQASASCGCTVPEYPKEPIKPGESGKIVVTYNGEGRFPGHFRKSITIRSNAKQEIVRLYIEGDMQGQ